jgi:drug/metabolite transporter (DMT)-like permease
MGWLEYIIVTPSQHRVHHAINPEYIDKNLGQILCIWDRWFGTFQEELDDVPPQYGVLKPAHTWNPILINFQHLWRLMVDAWHTRSLKDKLRIWIMPTGWRPEDVRDKYPSEIIEDVYSFRRYDTQASPWLKGYAVFQLLSTLGLTLFMFYNYTNIGFDGLLLFGSYVFLGIFGYTSLMDRRKFAFAIELIRSVVGIAVIWNTGDWFGINTYLPEGSLLVALYFVITAFGGFYFTFVERKGAEQQIAM